MYTPFYRVFILFRFYALQWAFSNLIYLGRAAIELHYCKIFQLAI